MNLSTYFPVTGSLSATQTVTWDNGRLLNGVYTAEPSTLTASVVPPTNSVVGVSYETHGEFEQRPASSDHDSWSAIKRSGVIKMTPWRVSRSSFVNHIGSSSRNAYDWKYYHSARCNSNTATPRGYWWVVKGPKRVEANGSHQLNGDYYYWKSVYPDVPHYSSHFIDAAGEIAAAKNEAWSSVLSGYQLGQDIGEMGQTISFLTNVLKTARHPLQAYRDARELLLKQYHRRNYRNKAADLSKALSDLWLQYRYALMPIIYSVQDVMKLMETSPEYITERGHVDHSVENDTVFNSGNYFYDEVSASATTRITVKGRFGGGVSSRDRVDFNWITTAWELIPYSFVIDWFINVGDWLGSVVKSHTTNASEIIGCASTLKKITKRTYLHQEIDERASFTSPGTSGWCGVTATPPVYFSRASVTETFGDIVYQDFLLYESTDEVYSREVFTNTDLSLSFDPNLNWKRIIDATALTLPSITKALRRLK